MRRKRDLVTLQKEREYTMMRDRFKFTCRCEKATMLIEEGCLAGPCPHCGRKYIGEKLKNVGMVARILSGTVCILKKDLVIPAGTVMRPSPRVTTRFGKGHFGAEVGLSKDSSGTLTYFVDPNSKDEELEEWLRVVK